MSRLPDLLLRNAALLIGLGGFALAALIALMAPAHGVLAVR